MANAAAPAPKANMGEPAVRLDARLKVTGDARCPSDVPVGSPAYAYFSRARSREVASSDCPSAQHLRSRACSTS
jgi:hypothetical protein